MKSLSEAGYSKKSDRSKYESIRRRLDNFYKQTFTTKSDWKHIVDTSGNILKIWLTNVEYNGYDRIHGNVVLFMQHKTERKSELHQYTTRLKERYGDSDGRYHRFERSKDTENKNKKCKQLTHHLEMEKQEMRTNTYVKRLREGATLKENAAHNNVISTTHNNLVGVVDGQQKMIEELQRELMRLKLKAA